MLATASLTRVRHRMFTNKDFALDHERRMLMQGNCI
jgi:hypothetical protein